MVELIGFMETQGIEELSTRQVINGYNVYVTIEKPEEYEEVEDEL